MSSLFSTAPSTPAAQPLPSASPFQSGQTTQAPSGFGNAFSALGQALGMPSAPIASGPPLTASFAQPSSGKITAPAVITSSAAEDHVNGMHNTLATAHNDVATNTAYNSLTQGGKVPINPTADQLASRNGAAAQGSTNSNTNDSSTSHQIPLDQSSSQSGINSNPNSNNADLTALINSVFGEGSAVSGVASSAINAEQAQVSADKAAIAALQDPENPYGIPATTDALYAMANGSYPLTPSQQGQINAIPGQYSTAMQAAIEFGKNLVGGATALNASTGLQQYSPGMALSNIATAIQKGSVAIGKVNTQITNAQSKMQAALEDGDYKGASLYMAEMDKLVTSKTHEIDQINTAIEKQQTNMQDWMKSYVTDMIDNKKADTTSMNDANNLAYKYEALSEKAYNDNQKLISALTKQGTAAERAATTTAAFGAKFVPGATMKDGTPVVDNNGYITPAAWNAAINDAPAEGLTRVEFIKAFGNQIYSKDGKSYPGYKLSPQEVKLITGAVSPVNPTGV